MKIEKHAKLILLKNTMHQSYYQKARPVRHNFLWTLEKLGKQLLVINFLLFFYYKPDKDSVFVHVFRENKMNAWLTCHHFHVSLSITEFTDEASTDPEWNMFYLTLYFW